MPEKKMKWQGRTLHTVGDLMRAIQHVKTRDEARRFMKRYREVNIHAYQDIGYLIGYFPREAMHRLYDWFQTSHPVFGTADLSDEEIYEMGLRWGEESKKKLESPRRGGRREEQDAAKHPPSRTPPAGSA